MASYKRHGSGWQARVRKRGRSIAKTFDTKTLARAWATRMEAQIDQEAALGVPAPLDYTLGEGIRRYKTSQGKADHVWGKTKAQALAMLEDEIGDWTLDMLTAPALVAWAETRRCRFSTTRVHLVTLGAVLKSISNADKPVDAKAHAVAIERLQEAHLISKKNRTVSQRVSDAQIRDLEAVWQPTGLPFDLVWFALASTFRLGEICRIRWDDLENGNIITIRDRKDPKNKYDNDGRVALLGDAPAIIARQPRLTDRIFPFNSASISSFFIQRRNLTKHTFRFHDLRHERITRLFALGMSIPMVATVTGHKDWKTLQIYTKVNADEAHLEYQNRIARS